MTRIACVGITVQDRIYSLNNLPDGGGKYQSNQYLETGVGPAATAAVAIARLGIDGEFIGRVGERASELGGQYGVLPAIPELPFIPVRNFGRPAWRTHYRELSKPGSRYGCKVAGVD